MHLYENINEEEIIKNISKLKDLRIQPESLCLRAIEINPYVLKYIKYQFQTETVITAALTKNGLALEYVFDKNEKYCLIAVEQNGNALQFIVNQTPKICKVALKSNPDSIRYTIKQTNKLCLYAINNSSDLHLVLGAIRKNTS